MKFTKMQGLGNDSVCIDCTDKTIPDPETVAIRLSDRHFGVGADGVILITRSETADFGMTVYNPDGTRARLCGNGLRCVGKFVYDKGLTDKTELTVETDAGIKNIKLKVCSGRVKSVTVDMGEPTFTPEEIPLAVGAQGCIDLPVKLLGKDYRVNCVSVGNPHAVIFWGDSTDLISLDLKKLGAKLESSPLFPERTNTAFVKIIDRSTIAMRVWERGVGETLSCGTGACAALVASVLTGRSERSAQLRLLGGSLDVSWNEDNNRIYMTGPAETAFEGEVELE